MNTNALRKKILDLAIQGKLVKQDPNDESAAILLEKIRTEKAEKIKNGELKAHKNDLYIFKYTGESDDSKPDGYPAGYPAGLKHNRHYEKLADGRVKDIEDEIPFVLPEGWAWCRLGEIGVWRAGSTPNRKNIAFYKNGTIPWLLTGDLNDGIITDIPNKITEEAYSQTSLRLNPTNSICIAMYGATIGKLGILSTPATTNQACCVCSDFKGISNKYLFYFLLQHREKFVLLGFGGAQPNISKEKIITTLIPLPPLAEQRRIVGVIEAIFAQIDILEKNKADLQTAVKQAKSKILDLAVRGKLVPQDPADEPASVMLEKLRVEKEAKIAAGERKRGKNDSYIYKNPTDNCYYEKLGDKTEKAVEIHSILPESWIWCYVGDIADVVNGKNQSKVGDDTGEYPIYGSGGIIGYANDYICPENCTIIGRKGSINNPIFVKEKFWNVDTAFGLVPTSIVLPRYLFYFCKSFDFTSLDSSTTLPSLTKTSIQHILFPLPSLAEQQRILDKVDDLFTQLDEITLNIV